MADSEQTPSKPEAGEQPAEQGSVFGNLPESRPGVRSPRRGKSLGAGRAGGTTAKSTPRQPRPAKEAGRPSPSGPAARPPSRPLTHEPAAPPPDEAEPRKPPRGRASRDRYRAERSSALPWLYGIAGNVLRRHQRAERQLDAARRRLAAYGGEDLLTMAAAVPCGEVVCQP